MSQTPVAVPTSGRAVAASIGKNTLFGVVGAVVHLLARLLVVPVAIHHIGLDGYGIWAVLMTIAAYMSLGAAGIKSAFQKYVAEATGSRDFDRASRLLSTGAAAVLLISVIVLLPLAIFSYRLAIAVGVPAVFLSAASQSIRLLALTACFANFSQVFQSIIMGAHRIDLREKLNLFLEPLNAAFTIGLLYLGFGLVAMCAVFCAYQIAGGILWYFYSRRLLPMVHVSPRFISRSLVRELIRFSGSYGLVSMLELLYAAVLPVAILRFFGASAAGIYALSIRLVSVPTTVQGAYLQAVISGGSLVYASGSPNQTVAFIVKSFKALSVISVIPLAFLAVYGAKIAWIWTGRNDSLLWGTICLLCIASIFRALSSLCRVLYRVAGGVVMDNAQLILALAIALVLSPFGAKIGFLGMVFGVSVVGQFLGLVLMIFALTKEFKGFSVRLLAPNFLRFLLATSLIIGVSIAAIYLRLPGDVAPRLLETFRIAVSTIICLSVAGPALILTGSVSRSEVRLLIDSVMRKGASAA